MSRQKLDEWAEERLIPVSYSSKKPKETEDEKLYYMQLDCERYFVITEKISRTAIRVANLMLMEVNHFTNIFSGTYEEVEEKLQLSKRPVREAITELEQVDFIRRYKNGRYMINPAVAIGCKKDFRPKIFDTYHSLETITAKRKRSGKNADR